MVELKFHSADWIYKYLSKDGLLMMEMKPFFGKNQKHPKPCFQVLLLPWNQCSRRCLEMVDYCCRYLEIGFV